MLMSAPTLRQGGCVAMHCGILSMGAVDVIFGRTINTVIGMELSCRLDVILLEGLVTRGSHVAVV